MENNRKKVLFISSEMSPFLESNPLSDIARMLPQAVQEKDNEVRILVPRFGVINERRNRLHEVVRLSGMNITIDDNDNPLTIKVASIPSTKMQVYFLDNEDFFHRKSVYGDENQEFFKDNDERTIFFCKGALETVKKLGWYPDIIHCHGWMTSLIPLYLKTIYKDEPVFSNSKVVYSVFNNEFQASLGEDFSRKASLNHIEDNEMKPFENADCSSMYIGAIANSDAVVKCQELSPDVLNYLNSSSDKPVLEHNGENIAVDYTEFYDTLLARISRKAARRAALLFLFSITVFVGCKEANDIVGENFIDKDLYLNTSLIDTLAVKTYTIKEDSLKIDSLSATLLGAIHDGDFGISSASAYLQILLREINVDFGTNPTIDSVVLSIAKHTGVPSYGSSASTNEMEVFQMAEIIQSEKSYYSNYKPKLGNKIGDWKYNLRLADTVWFEEDGQMNWLINTYRIRLDKSFGEDLVANGNFGSNEAFLQTLNGIAIVPKSSSLAVGEGSIVALNKNSDQSKLIVYYNGNLRKEFDITSESQNISSYEVVHTNTELLNQISNPGTNYSKCYVQSMAGCKMKIEIPGLLDLAKTGGEYAINEAEITFKLESGSVTDHFSAPTRLLLVQPSEVDGSNAFILDLVDQLIPPTSQWLGHTTYGGSYNASNQIYTFRFTRHLQQLFDEYKTTGNDNNRGFYLIIPSDNPITPSRAIINTGNTGTVKNLKVNIRYTKL